MLQIVKSPYLNEYSSDVDEKWYTKVSDFDEVWYRNADLELCQFHVTKYEDL